MGIGNLYPVYVRGLAYLTANRGSKAALSFRKYWTIKVSYLTTLSLLSRIYSSAALMRYKAIPPRPESATMIFSRFGETPIRTFPS